MKATFRSALALALCAGLAVPVASAQIGGTSSGAAADPAPQEIPSIDVIGVTPLPGLGVPLDQVPTAVQLATGEDIRRRHALNLEDYLNQHLNGVNVNAMQNNPFQLDVTYHGFRASPLLGAPVGLSVYQDGVRVNEAFGNTVNWDLIPESSIATTTLISGSNPTFGLNTLGGAISVRTKDGRSDPGSLMQFSGGSFGRGDAQAQTGGTFGHFAGGNFDYFITGNYFHEDGWRDASPSLVRQLFGKLGWENDTDMLHLSYNWANNDLIGNGVVPVSLYEQDHKAVYTSPDLTRNRLHFLNLTASHGFTDTLLLSGNVYYRDLKTRTLNGDDNDDFEADDCRNNVPGGLGGDFSAASSPGDIAVCAHGIDRRSHIRQRAFGTGWELTESRRLYGLQNQGVVGVDFSSTLDSFAQVQQYRNLSAQRATIPLDSPFNPLLDINGLAGQSLIYGAYVTDTLSPTGWLHLTASARYNRNKEKLNGHTFDPEHPDTPEPMVIDHGFNRLNPAIGFTLTPTRTLTLYADYNEGSRSPSLIELGCADPERPCGMPNSFASDPELKQVVSRTFEIGARGSVMGKLLGWNANLYHTRNANDIQFVQKNTTEGYFDNIGTTRHQGLDLGLHGELRRLTWSAGYSFVDATYRSGFSLNAGGNSSCVGSDNDACLIEVRPGNRMPLIPRHTGRLALGYAVTDKWDVGINLLMASGQFLTGNENNANHAGGNTGYGGRVLGSGRTGGYVIVNLDTNYKIASNVDLFMHVINLFDRKYATGGFLTSSTLDAHGQWQNNEADRVNENFIAPGPPIAAWVGIRVRFL